MLLGTTKCFKFALLRGREGERGVEIWVRWGAGSEDDGVSSGDSRDARGRFLLAAGGRLMWLLQLPSRGLCSGLVCCSV